MRPESPVKIAAKQPDGITVAEAMKTVQGYTPPAVWLPYVKMGQSGTGIVCDKSGGKFGPFEKQLFLGEFVLSGVNRVFLEKVGGEYQGACFPFVDGLQCAALALTTLPDGSLVVGESNRGWNSKGNRPFGLQKIVWTKKTPLEVQKMELTKSGFRFTFTLPLDKASLSELTGQSYTYPFQSKYGGEELDAKPLQITSSTLSDDGLTLESGEAQGVALAVAGELDGGAVDVTEVGAGEDVALQAGGVDLAVFEQEAVGDAGEDFFDVMGDHDEGRGVRFAARLHPLKVMLAGDGIEAGAGFVEDEDGEFGHQGAADEHFLFLALGERPPEGVAEVGAADLLQQPRGFAEHGGRGHLDEVELGLATAGDDIEHGFAAFEDRW
jgi:hypothetical protein